MSARHDLPQPAQSATWPDGTPKSSGNAFTSHGYERGVDMADAERSAGQSSRSTAVWDKRIARGESKKIYMHNRGQKG